VWTGSQLELPGDLDPVCLVAEKPTNFTHVPVPEKSANFIRAKTRGGGVR
jgi:hypothetical protein